MIELLSPGPLATVQDLGRAGLADLGVSRSGAFDRGALRLANRLVGNDEAAAGIEFTLGGLVLRLVDAATIAFTGARCELSDHRGGWNAALSCPAGSVLATGAPRTGLRSYLAVRGGLAVAPVLGSHATDTLSGLGPAVLRAGGRLAVGTATASDPGDFGGVAAPAAGTPTLRLAAGPRAGWFDSDSVGRLFDSSWRVGPDSNRIGTRLVGTGLRLRPDAVRAAAELPSEPTVPGAVQVPPDGQPIVLGPDAPVTGGYPVIAVLPAAELDLLAQLRPGAELRFAPVPIPLGLGLPDFGLSDFGPV
jgi:biotin-dependent carboxylase-like uncharacterized protein